MNSLFVKYARHDRGFVKWKMRLDKLFGLFLTEDLGNGPVVDLGCGHGLALAVAGFRDPGRRLIGCDLDARRIETARRALQPLRAELSLADVRNFEFRDAGLIVIIDVLQYLRPEEQLTLLRRCCSLLAPGGRLICRIHDKNRGIASLFSLGLDRLLCLLRPTDQRTTVLSSAEYSLALRNAGMVLREQPFINRLPLAHILLTAEKPSVQQG